MLRGPLVHEQPRSHHVGEPRTDSRDDADHQVDVGKRRPRSDDRPTIDDHARHVELDPWIALAEEAREPSARRRPTAIQQPRLGEQERARAATG